MLFIDKYISEKSLTFYEQIKDKKTVYLDLKYWILLRDAGNGKNPIMDLMLEKVMSLHQTGKCVFPVSELVLIEIMKQSDERTRTATLKLAEKLSDGIAIINETQRVKNEFWRWWSKLNDKESVKDDPRRLVWAAFPLVTGYFFYSQKAEELPAYVKRSFLDFVCSIPLSSIPANPDIEFEPFDGKDNTVALNAYKELYKDQNKTFKEMFLSELWGCLDCFKDDLNAVLKEKAAEDPDNTDIYALCRKIYDAFKDGKVGDDLPTFNIFPTLFGVTRWNKDRRYKDGNDTLDIKHASCALPYCDYFFTEKELHTMICQYKLDRQFQCTVASKPKDILEILQAI
ncbi:hypothetical protein [Mucilaginibacter lappiensis]|uniref:Uncharacterized protein n=1 Tax=Mucilaginibacter lappiensis TaxID=354630 RepID=A0A841J8U1_9SPHI|nr:hypothetical protein [Mucilaginibacter lappiensis]MBB6127180.1 hypothetical protein [Mucilaginibacter lappiensis]